MRSSSAAPYVAMEAVEIPLRPLQSPLDDEPFEPLRRKALRIARPEIERQRHELGRARDVASLQLRIRELLPRERHRLPVGLGPRLFQKPFEERHLPPKSSSAP